MLALPQDLAYWIYAQADRSHIVPEAVGDIVQDAEMMEQAQEQYMEQIQAMRNEHDEAIKRERDARVREIAQREEELRQEFENKKNEWGIFDHIGDVINAVGKVGLGIGGKLVSDPKLLAELALYAYPGAVPAHVAVGVTQLIRNVAV